MPKLYKKFKNNYFLDNFLWLSKKKLIFLDLGIICKIKS